VAVEYYLGCAHEQFPPGELLEQAVRGERAGFDGISCSDHFQPWWEPGESGQAWMWLGAAAQATERVPVGPAVTVGLRRYHPALVAQAFATLEAMFPGRCFVGLGSGESLNESPLGCDWPSPPEQLEALQEAVALIRRLWSGEHVTQDGRFPTKDAYLHTRPAQPPPLYVSAFHEGAAEVAGRHGDGLWTLADPETVPKLVETWRGAAEEAGRDPGKLVLQAQFSWAPDDDSALEGARVWKGAVPDEYYTDDWHDPAAMYAHGEETVSDDAFKEQAIVSSDPEKHVERIREIEKLGADIIGLMNISGHDPMRAIEVYGSDVLPALRSNGAGRVGASTGASSTS
jgi:coenzyme F420-dependent glucose-6-phosphate dehydrogenase